MRYGILTPNFGLCGHPGTLIELAQVTESAGWDGFFLWDHLQWPGMEPAADPWVALSAIAVQTESINIGTLVTPLPRRDIVKLAREMITLDQLSSGRVILGVGLGWQSIPEYAGFGHEEDAKVRGDMLDEGLQVLDELLSGKAVSHVGTHYKVVTDQPFAKPSQSRIPLWIAGQWPSKKPFRRAARWDGVVPMSKTAFEGGKMAPSDLREILALMRNECEQRVPYDVVLLGTDPLGAEEMLAYAEAGATWYVEPSAPFTKTVDEMKEQIRRGPPK